MNIVIPAKEEFCKELLIYLCKALVDTPNEVRVGVKWENENAIFEITVNKKEVGQIIGKGGKIAESIRRIVSVCGKKYHLKTCVRIVE